MAAGAVSDSQMREEVEASRPVISLRSGAAVVLCHYHLGAYEKCKFLPHPRPSESGTRCGTSRLSLKELVGDSDAAKV
jgi:hypothetical protein